MKTTLHKVFLLFVIAAFGSFGCDGLLDVNNPNSVLEENLANPSAANAIASGALSTTAYAVGFCLAPYTVATDEGVWIGSRDAWNQLDRGFLADFNNEFVDAAWPFITEARYTCDNAISLLNTFKSAGTLKDSKNLAKAYLYSAVARLTIGDMFDDFVYSSKREAKPPIGETNMVNVYSEAIANLDAALAILQSTPDPELQRRVLALRARAKHAKAVWSKVNPKPAAPAANPYVSDGADDATAALALMTANYRWQFTYPGAIGTAGFNEWAWEVVGRSEMNTAPVPKDIIDAAVDDPRIANEIKDFKDKVKHVGDRNSPFTVVSEREMQLILAESKVVSDPAGATTILNALRARDSLKPLAPQGGVTVEQLLQHERRANLYMMGRRLTDMYRFGIKDPRWVPTSDAITVPGSFFPITIQERRANQFLTGGR